MLKFCSAASSTQHTRYVSPHALKPKTYSSAPGPGHAPPSTASQLSWRTSKARRRHPDHAHTAAILQSRLQHTGRTVLFVLSLVHHQSVLTAVQGQQPA
jgi:hypothetical protein